MEHSRPTLLWGIDCQSGKISALPASPLLLPAALFFGVLWLIGLFIPKQVKREPMPENFNEKEYMHNSIQYHYLCGKIRDGIELTDSERFTLRRVLPYPSWAKPGEFWTY